MTPTTQKTKVYEEKFVSPFEKDTVGGAERVLAAIREAHPASSGWAEIESGIEPLPNGKFRAWRRHAKYR